MSVVDGPKVAIMMNGPAAVASNHGPPRKSTPGSPVVAAPARHWRSSSVTPELQVPHVVERGTHSATHSARLPTMSNAPRADTQFRRDLVSAVASVLFVLQSVVPLSLPGSGLPAAAACHSAFVGSRLREFLQACCAWNQVIHPDGMTPGRLAA